MYLLVARFRREGGGLVSEGVPPERVLYLFDTSDPLTTSEVADALGVAQKTAYNKLGTLQERGDIRKKEMGHCSDMAATEPPG